MARASMGDNAPVITIRRGQERGRTRLGWLDSHHTFSFNQYYDPAHMGFRSLRVINEDVVAPGQGFGTHGHRDMEIFSYVLDGGLQHRDSMGTGSEIRPGEIQFMRAGTGVTHSEYNASESVAVHFLQIWIIPSQAGLPPAYGQIAFDEAEAKRGFSLLASPDGHGGSLQVQQDVELFVAMLAPGGRRSHELKAGRHAWVQVARGALSLNGQALTAGDGASVSGEARVELEAGEDAELLLFDLG